MKFAFALLTLAVSFQATASVSSIPCTFEDYQSINSALDSKVDKGTEFTAELKGLLMEEMGPQCRQLVSDEVSATIPGTTISTYEISAPGRSFDLVISVNRVESSGNYTSITKK